MKPITFCRNDFVPWKKASFFFFVSISLLPISLSSFSQNRLHPNFARYSDNVKSVVYLRLNEVNIHAVRHFYKNFLSGGNERWVKDNNCYTASFSDGPITSKVYYKSNGAFICSVKCYEADALDKNLQSVILKKFEGYSISVVTEINNLEQHFYFIKINNSTNIKTLRCVEGNIEVTEDYINGGA